ncbi:protein of unknown function [uncultured Woeseiaceae bacterium]|uniref:Uncharacterized protein n=1 Tax=uncultured Woeseiaceae bacterium TaxID=1983305 RepID=A0A7D9D147_9GAMM|nr:protein of unknown function [uncultured Woeseiaceae bacterium]
MLTEIYLEALLADSDLADQVWDAWNARTLNDTAALIAWTLIVCAIESSPPQCRLAGARVLNDLLII